MKYYLLIIFSLAVNISASCQKFSDSSVESDISTKIDSLLIILHTPDSLVKKANLFTKLILERDPRLIGAESLIRNHFLKIYNYESLKQEYINFYSQKFTKQDIEKLIIFFTSETGQKYYTSLYLLDKEAGIVTTKAYTNNTNQLRVLIDNYLRERAASQINSIEEEVIEEEAEGN